MKTLNGIMAGLAVSAIAITTASGVAVAGKKSHAHMGHVSKSWNDTPEKAGLLPTAITEAKIAAFHSAAAASKLDNLKWMQLHTHHVLHAVDASLEKKGPGKGYGVKKAAAGAAFHIKVAAKQKDASKVVTTHAVHIAASAQNTVDRVAEIVAVANKVLAAKSAAEAAPMVKEMAKISAQLEKGVDANGDGKVTWEKGEGGLNVAAFHMNVMNQGEGL